MPRTRITAGRKTGHYDWRRPNGEKIKLKGFTKNQVQYLSPTLYSLDYALKPKVKIKHNVSVAKRGQVENLYKHYNPHSRAQEVGGLTQRGLLRKDQIKLSPRQFQKGSYFDARGVLTHEVGHAVSKTTASKKKVAKDWAKSYGYKPKQIKDPFSWKKTKQNPLRKAKTRQGQDAHEDFAETFRSVMRQPITRRPDKYFKVDVDRGRAGHLKRHYLR